jgi:hypothetical protein
MLLRREPTVLARFRHPKATALAAPFKSRDIETLSVILYGDSEALFSAIQDDPDIPGFGVLGHIDQQLPDRPIQQRPHLFVQRYAIPRALHLAVEPLGLGKLVGQFLECGLETRYTGGRAQLNVDPAYA